MAIAANPSIAEQVKQVVSQAKVNLEAHPAAKPAQEGQSNQAAGEKQQPKLPAFMDDIDVTGLSPDTVQKLIEKGKQLHDGFQKKQTALSVREKQLAEVEELANDLQADPELSAEINRIYHAKKAGIDLKSLSNTAQAKAEKLKKFDQWIEKSEDPLVRENLSELRQAIHEDLGVDQFQKKLDDIEKLVRSLAQTHTVSRQEQLTAEIEQLPDSLKELAQKYKPQLLRYGVSSTAKVRQLLPAVVPIEEYDSAVLQTNESSKKREIESKRDLQNPPGAGQVIAADTLKIRKNAPTSSMFGETYDIRDGVSKILNQVKRGMGVGV